MAKQIYTNLLDEIVNNVPYYQGRKITCIEELPLVNKTIIKEDYDKFISNRIMNKQEVVKMLKQSESIEKYIIEKRINNDISIEWTSGSSGIPFKCLKNNKERKILSFNMWKRRMSIDRRIQPSNFLPLIHTGSKSFVYDIRDYSKKNIVAIYDYISKNKIFCLHVTPTILVRHMESGYLTEDMTKSLGYIECTGRYLSEETKHAIEDMYNVKVINMYGTIETWEIGYTCSCGLMHVNEDNIYIELIDDKGEVIHECGVVGNVVITALNLYSMPFVRYETNDYAKYVNIDCKCGNKEKVIELVPYRKVHIMRLVDKEVNGEDIIRGIIKKIFFIQGFQDIDRICLEQYSINKFILKLNEIENKDVFEKLFCDYLMEKTGKDIKIKYEYIDKKYFDSINPKNYIFRRLY